MKIALVHKDFTLQGGTERYLVGLACFLAERGHEVHVFCRSVDPVLAGIAGIHFHRFRLPPLGGLGKVVLFWIATQLNVQRSAFDVVHGFGRTTGHDVVRAGGGCHRAFFEGLLARAKTGWQRLRLTLGLRHRLLMWMERRQLTEPSTQRFLAVSEMGRRELRERYPVRDGLIQVLHNGVDTQRFHPKNRRLFFSEVRDEQHLVPEDTVILFVGGDWERKGLEPALRVLAALQDVPDLKLLVVGTDRRFPQFAARARELGVLDQVHWAGPVARIERIYGAVDLMLLPTRYDPFANVTLEALATEVPVITTRHNGASEVLADCEAVWLVDDAEDVEGMAAGVRALLDRPDQKQLREAAREAALENRDTENFERVEALYQEIQARRPGGAAR